MVDVLSMLAALVAAGTVAAFIRTRVVEGRRPRLLCLMYHRFALPAEYDQLSGTERIFTVPVDRFATQLDRLKEHGFRSVTVREAVEFVQGRTEFDGPSVLLTIDDGCRSVRTHAEPVLRNHGFSAVLFVTTDPKAHVFGPGERQQRLSDEELRGLDRDVVDVQSHGVTHRPLVTLSDNELRGELRGGREELERILGRSVTYLAIPGNWHDRRVRRFARESGFDGLFVSDAGTNHSGGDPFRIRRINVEGCGDLRDFEAALTPSGTTQLRFVSALKRLPGRLIGPGLWLPTRQVIRSFIRPEALSFKALRRVGAGVSILMVITLLVWWLVR